MQTWLGTLSNTPALKQAYDPKHTDKQLGKIKQQSIKWIKK